MIRVLSLGSHVDVLKRVCPSQRCGCSSKGEVARVWRRRGVLRGRPALITPTRLGAYYALFWRIWPPRRPWIDMAQAPGTTSRWSSIRLHFNIQFAFWYLQASSGHLSVTIAVSQIPGVGKLPLPTSTSRPTSNQTSPIATRRFTVPK